jgi:MerR family transcriptional regulator, light-induced transcriptional regulator
MSAGGQLSRERRRTLASRLRQIRDEVAEAVTREFFERHPDWLERYGDLGWRRGVEDARFHVDFLGAAVEAGSAQIYEDYGRWTSRVLSARGIAATFLIENLRQVETSIALRLGVGDDRSHIAALTESACAAAAEPAAFDSTDRPSAFSADRTLFLRAILSGDRGVARTIAREAVRRPGFAVSDVYMGLIEAAMGEIGELWERNQITVAQEHIATAVVQSVLVELRDELPAPKASQGRILITGVQGEMHQIGSLMAAEMIESIGWTVRYLGSNLPARPIVEAIREFAPAVVGISVTMPFNLPVARELIESVRAGLQPNVPRILVAGRAFRSVENLPDIGADEYVPDLRAALRILGAMEVR